ncbi:MAG TPA: chromate transporter [Rhodanobacter sp.]
MQRMSKSHRVPLAPWTEVFTAFARIGLTSFGGGSATVSAMRQLCLRKRWLTEAEFISQLVLSRLTPGISILAQVILIGRTVCGVRGMAAGLAGLMIPSLTITIVLAWGYELISAYPRAQVPLHAVAGMAAGFAISLAIQLFRDIMRPVPFLRATLIFLLFAALGVWLNKPLLVMGIAIALALIFPDVFDMVPQPPKTGGTNEP